MFFQSVNLVNGQTLFQKQIGGISDERFPRVIDAAEGGHIIFSRTKTSSFGDDDFSFFKIDSTGNILWQKHIGTNKRNVNKQIIHFKDNYLAVGWLTLYNLVDDLCFMIYDENGSLLKMKSYGASYDDEIMSVAKMENDKFVFVGESLSFELSGGPDMFISTVDGNLNIEPLTVYYGGGGIVPRKVLYTKDKSFFISGTYRYGGSKGFVMKTDLQGNNLWSFYFGSGETMIWNTIELDDGSLACVGQTNGYGASADDILFLKFSASGSLLASKIIGGSGVDKGVDIIKSSDGNLVIVGTTGSFGNAGMNVCFIKIDANGNFINGYTYGGDKDEELPSIAPAGDSLGFVVGFESNSYGLGDKDIIIVRTDIDGKSCCSQKIEGISDKNIQVSLLNPEFYKTSRSFDESSNPLRIEPTYFNNEELCITGVEIVGPDTLVCTNVADYTINPSVLLNLIWKVPESATIINNVNDTAVTIDFGNESGVIYLLSGNCPSDTLDSLNVFLEGDVLPFVDLGPDTSVCTDQLFMLYAGGGYDSYLWQDGSTGSVFEVDTSGTYWVTVENGCGSNSDTIEVIYNETFSFNLGDDTLFCYGNSMLISPGGGYVNYLWQDGSNDTVMIADTDGVYWVQITDSAGCSATDSLVIETYFAFNFTLGTDTTICDGDYIFLNGPDGYESYLWQDGSDFPSFIANIEGCYWLEVYDTNHCAARDSLFLTTNLVPDTILGPDTLFCNGGSISLQTNPEYEKYFWQDGSEEHALVVDQPGKYWVTVFDTLGCTGSDTIMLDYYSPLELRLQAIGYLCEDDSVVLNAVSNYDSFIWQDSSDSQVYIAKDSGIYWVRVSSPCELKSDTIVIDACSSIWVPNVFTPNNDGYNDYFHAVGKNIPKFKMEIFNRWGQTLKVLSSIDEKWDGTYRGNKASQGTYFWVADYEQVKRDGSTEHVSLQGSVTLVR